ncbi:MAG: hypothetical protein P8X74_09845 [Reinekea sp.]|jgi:outer membrane protein
MKKWAAATALVVAMPMASAKVLISIDGGLGFNLNSLSEDSNIANDIDLAKSESNGLGMEANGGFYSWAKISLPILPDVKLKYENLTMSGKNSAFTQDINFGPQAISVSGEVETEIDLSYLDMAFTYGIPLPMVNIDFGLNARSLMGGLTVDSGAGHQEVDFTVPDSDTPLILPMGYVAVEGSLPIPGIDIKVGGELVTLPLGDTNLTDWNIKGTWYAPLPSNMLVKLGVETGFRHFSMTIGDSTLGYNTSDLASDISLSSFFIGGTLHF